MSPAEDGRGRPQEPVLDDRRWPDLVAETTALIERYAPQWTDRGPSDLGVTLVELFAWLVEGLVYRLNRVPEKNYVAFLNLLGILREPATPARTLLTFTTLPGHRETVPAGSLAQTKGSESETAVVFQTDAPVRLTPAAIEVALSLATGACTDISTTFLPPAATGATVALGGTVLLGLDPRFDGAAEDVELYAELGVRDEAEAVRAEWVYSATNLDPARWPAMTVVDDSSSGLARAGQVRLRPGGTAWSTQDTSGWTTRPAQPPGNRRWLGLRLTGAGGPVTVKYLLLNTVPASTALTEGRVAPENLGTATGTRQTFPLRNRPVHGPARITVDGTEWTVADTAATGPGRFYRLEPITGEVTFGMSPDWELPPAGARVEATYRYVAASAAGNVARGAVGTIAEGLTNVIAVTNPVPGTGGIDEEPVEQTKARAPLLLRTRDRAVTADDYELLVREEASDIAIVRCLPPQVHADHTPWTYAGLLRAPGNVNVVIVPDLGPGEPRPVPGIASIHQVLAALDSRRDVTALLKVTGPRYLPIRVRVAVQLFERAVRHNLIPSAEAEYTRIAGAVERFLHPVYGGPDGHGWQVGQSVYLADVYRAVKPDDRVGYLADLGLVPAVPLYHDPARPWSNAERPIDLPTAEASLVRVADYELICFGGVSVDKPPLE
jgi:hypothetical protein